VEGTHSPQQAVHILQLSTQEYHFTVHMSGTQLQGKKFSEDCTSLNLDNLNPKLEAWHPSEGNSDTPDRTAQSTSFIFLACLEIDLTLHCTEAKDHKDDKKECSELAATSSTPALTQC